MNIFNLSEKELNDFLEKELKNISSEELLNELIECGLELQEEIRFYDKAQYKCIEESCCEAIWYSTKTTGWTNFKQIFNKKMDDNKKLEEAA